MHDPSRAWLALLLFSAACSGSAPPEPSPPAAPTTHVGDEPPSPAPPAPEPEDQGAAPDPTASERAAFERARPVFDEHCARCHTAGGAKSSKTALSHFDMSREPYTGHHAHELGKVIPEVLGASGKKATMPKDQPGAVQGEELEAIVAWARAFEQAHPPEDDHGAHEHTH